MRIIVSEDTLVPHQLSICDSASTKAGAVSSFTGLMRDNNAGDQVSAMFLDHYPGMTEKVLSNIAGAAAARWPLLGGVIAHRVGEVNIGDVLVYVEVHAAHRQDAFDGCNYIMDILKTEAPFWKKETTTSGDRWVDARDCDQQALTKWLK